MGSEDLEADGKVLCAIEIGGATGHGNAGDAGEEDGEDAAYMGMHVTMLQGEGLARNRAYLDNCSTVTAFKDSKYIENLRTTKGGMTVNCNAGAVRTNQVGDFGRIRAWYMPKGIANIFSMHQLEKLYLCAFFARCLSGNLLHVGFCLLRFHGCQGFCENRIEHRAD